METITNEQAVQQRCEAMVEKARRLIEQDANFDRIKVDDGEYRSVELGTISDKEALEYLDKLDQDNCKIYHIKYNDNRKVKSIVPGGAEYMIDQFRVLIEEGLLTDLKIAEKPWVNRYNLTFHLATDNIEYQIEESDINVLS